MRHAKLLLLLVVFLAAIPTSAQGVLPNSFAGWSGTTSAGLNAPVSYNGDKVGSMTAEQRAAARREYGFVSGEEGSYSLGKDTLQVTLYRMKDPSGAYGLYSYLRSPDMERSGATEHSVMSRDEALVLLGNLVLDIHGSDLFKNAGDLNALVSAVSSTAQRGPLPTLTEHLPTKGFIDRSDKYILGPVTLNQFFPVSQNDWLGFATGAEAEVAKYRVDGRELNLLNAADADQNGSPVFGKRSITLLAIVFGARTEAEADKLLDQVQSGAEVTWNEPTFQFKEPPLTTMIVGAIIGTGIICCFALISGIAFGGFRIVVKRLLPDKVFDRSSTMQVLQLGLGSKPINSEDFYGIERNPPK